MIATDTPYLAGLRVRIHRARVAAGRPASTTFGRLRSTTIEQSAADIPFGVSVDLAAAYGVDWVDLLAGWTDWKAGAPPTPAGVSSDASVMVERLRTILREERVKAGLSQETLADVIGVSQATYSRYETLGVSTYAARRAAEGALWAPNIGALRLISDRYARPWRAFIERLTTDV